MDEHHRTFMLVIILINVVEFLCWLLFRLRSLDFYVGYYFDCELLIVI